VRGETVACLFLQRKDNAKRIYATVLNSGVNIDGNKTMGMFFPSSEGQEELMIKTYKEANVDPLEVNYFEAHATGTKVLLLLLSLYLPYICHSNTNHCFIDCVLGRRPTGSQSYL